MSAGCCDHNVKFDGLSTAYKRALWAVIAINGAMFLAEILAGIFAGSQALKADALDFLADTATYTITLFVIGMPLVWRARAALLKGLSLGVMGLWVLGLHGLSRPCPRRSAGRGDGHRWFPGPGRQPHERPLVAQVSQW